MMRMRRFLKETKPPYVGCGGKNSKDKLIYQNNGVGYGIKRNWIILWDIYTINVVLSRDD